MKYSQDEMDFSRGLEEESMSEDSEDVENEFETPGEFQEAMDRLKKVTAELESGDLPLEQAMERYQEGLKLIEFCEQRLEEAELLVEEVVDDENSGVEFNRRSPEKNG